MLFKKPNLLQKRAKKRKEKKRIEQNRILNLAWGKKKKVINGKFMIRQPNSFCNLNKKIAKTVRM